MNLFDDGDSLKDGTGPKYHLKAQSNRQNEKIKVS